ncbi:MAG: aminoglycoside phosphotransferase family protein [Actinomycetes bacterium]
MLDRDRSTVGAVEFDTTTGPAQSAWLKIRHERGLAPSVHTQERPRLSPLPSDMSDGALLEYRGLVHIERAVRQSGLSWMHAVEPLACLPDDATVVMGLVSQPTVKNRLRNLGTTARDPQAREVVATIGQRVGRWLREYQATPWEEPPVGGRPATVGAALDKLEEFHSYLADRGVDPGLLESIVERATLATSANGEPWVLVPCHGDFSPRNVLYRDPGDIWVIDPLPRWSVPPWEDLARFRLEAEVRLENRYPMALGGACAAAILRRELERGYLGDVPEPGPHAVLVEALVLLDGWSALVARSAGSRTTAPSRKRLKNRLYWVALERVSRRWVKEGPSSGNQPS